MIIKILFSDTSEMVNEVMMFAFENEGFTVTIADTPEKITQYAQQENYDLIILNWEMDAINTIAQIKKTTKNNNTKIFIISNTQNTENKKIAKEKGVSGWITKAFIPEQLVKAIRYFLLKYEHKIL